MGGVVGACSRRGSHAVGGVVGARSRRRADALGGVVGAPARTTPSLLAPPLLRKEGRYSVPTRWAGWWEPTLRPLQANPQVARHPTALAVLRTGFHSALVFAPRTQRPALCTGSHSALGPRPLSSHPALSTGSFALSTQHPVHSTGLVAPST